ncbi:MAG: hypothetical protein R3321_11605, partial [Nitrososphaeraceae archaeon]|nr:hypothetical protein [Nitrososphaeraceae archaeon]
HIHPNNTGARLFTCKHFGLVRSRSGSAYGLKEYYGICKIKYVHQLQNLYFALTVEELVTL